MGNRVVISDSKVLDLDATDAFAGTDVTTERTGATEPDELVEVVDGADAIVVDAGTRVTERVLATGSLSVVGRGGVGVDNIDVAAAAAHGVSVVNVPQYCTDEVATHALGLLLACVRKIPAFDRQVRNGGWDWSAGTPIRRLAGSSVGLVAFGNIARRLADRLSGFGVEIAVYDPYVPDAEVSAAGATAVEFGELLSDSDVVSLHAPLTDETAGMIDAAALDGMPDHAVLVNTARGELVDEAALATALDAGEIAAAGLDVRATEPPVDSPLAGREDCVFTPHVAWYSEAARRELNRTVAADVARVLRGEDPRNPVEPGQGWYTGRRRS